MLNSVTDKIKSDRIFDEIIMFKSLVKIIFSLILSFNMGWIFPYVTKMYSGKVIARLLV
jgi:hypothetical protein